MSVRKRVVKIMRDLCFKQPNNPFISDICKCLMGRIHDEEAIKVSIHHILRTRSF